MLTGCEAVSSDLRIATVCPPVVEYSREFQERAVEELESLPDGSAIAEMLSDHSVMRNQVRITLPKHWHPGEEFVYVLKGSLTLWQERAEDIVVHAGDSLKVPYKVVHTVLTGDDGVTLMIFRVHEAGQPERILVEESALAETAA